MADLELHELTADLLPHKMIRIISMHLHHTTAKNFSKNVQQMSEPLRAALKTALGYVSPDYQTVLVGDFNQTGTRGLTTV